MFDKLNTLAVANIDQFAIHSFDGTRLLVVGSADLSYYHNVEVEFTGVAYMACATMFYEPKFRIGTPRERRRIARIIADFEGTVYCVDADAGSRKQTFVIVAANVRVGELQP